MKRLITTLGLLLPVLAMAQNCLNGGSGVDGGFVASSDMNLPGGTYNFTSFTINPGVTVSVTGTNPLIIYSTGLVQIDGILKADGGNGANGVTYANGGIGGIGVAGGADGGSGSFASGSGPINGTDGAGSGGTNNKGAGWSGGGGGGYAAVGSSSGGVGGFGGPVYGTADLAGMLAGSGGGGGSGGYDCGAGGGGAGGGYIAIYTTSTVTIGAGGIISCNGGNGGTDGTGNCGGGGGGSGGAVFLRVNTLVNNGLIRANGGTGGASQIAGNPYYGVGGNGADGRIRIDYITLSGSGTVTPAAGYTVSPLIATPGAITAACAADGSASVVLSGGSGPFTYLWSNGQIGNPVTNLNPGFYACYVSDSYGCADTVYMNVPSAANGSSQSITICAGDSLVVGSSTYTASGSYSDIFVNAAGCDSTVMTTLTVLPVIASSQSFTICEGESVTVGNSEYTTSGTFTDMFTTVDGCDSTVTTQVTVSSITATASLLNNTLTASPAGESYQWYDCLNDSLIAGATSVTFTPSVNGQYAAIVTNSNNCSDTSACVVVDLVGLNALPVNTIAAYPNPTNGLLTVEFALPTERTIITDVTGRTIFVANPVENSLEIDLSNESKGVYFLHVWTEGKVQTLKITKQ